ncbi:MAG: DUF4837 family protein [Candidatus Cloacimonetes bacterium]|nr:DUF4837 family protein [Candidatus Cloacimonadota bacterium]
MYRISLLVLILGLLLAGCGKGGGASNRYEKYDSLFDFKKPLAHGDNDVVQVFAGRDVLAKNLDLLKRLIENEITLVYPEKHFEVQTAEFGELEVKSKYRNVIFLGDLESTDQVSEFLRNSLDKKLLDKVRTSGAELFSMTNYWVRDQQVLFFMAQNSVQLQELVEKRGEHAFNLLLERYLARLGYQAYQLKLFSPKFFESYPFALKLPENFRLFSNDKEGGFLSFLYRPRIPDRDIPDKYLSVYYEAMPADSISQEWMIKTRKAIGDKYFDGDILIEDSLSFAPISFAGFKALKMRGRWENHKHVIGGTFMAYAFLHEPSKRIYFVDNSVFFPAGDKLPFLLELSVISSTLEIK